MNNDSLLDYYYQKYKKYLLSILIVVIGIGVVWQVAVPQVFSILTVREDTEMKREEIAELEQSLTAINSFNDENLDRDIKTATTALPGTKEFLAMYLGVISASTKAQVTIVDFSTSVGTLYTRQGVQAPPERGTRNGIAPALSMKLTVDVDSPVGVQKFTEELHAVLPLAEVKTIEYNTDQAEYEVLFYYNTVDATALSKQVNINALSISEQELLEQMSVWNQQIVAPTGALQPVSESTPTPVSITPTTAVTPQASPTL